MAPTERERLFRELFEAYHTRVVAYVRRRVDADAAADVVANTFLAAWTSLDRLGDDPLPWLYGLARGAVANERRRLGRIGRLSERLGQQGAAGVVADHAEMVGWEDPFAAAFAGLRESEREVLRIVAWEGLSAREAGVVLGCSAAAFKVRLHRARRHLRRLLDAAGVEQPASRSQHLPIARQRPMSPPALAMLVEAAAWTDKERS